ncbi:MAG: TolC family protein [Flavobacteriales bacterium]|nr:TolC family protein [Flavobacteriales bacterium]
MKNKLFIIAFIFVLSSCKLFDEAKQVPILIPTSIAEKGKLIAVDSLNQNRQSNLPTVEQFFSDTILQRYIKIALKNNFDNRIALEKIAQQQAHVSRMKGILLPQLGIALGAGAKKFGNYTIDGVGNYDTQFSTNINDKQRIPDPVIPDYNIALTTSWEIDIWGKLKQQKKAVVNRYLASTFGQKFLQTNLISNVAESYYRLILFDEQVKLISENIELQEDALQISEAQKSSGKNNQLAVDILEAAVLSSKNDLLVLKKIILEEENNFNILIGTYPQNVRRSNWVDKISIPYLNEGVSSEVLLNRPDIQAAFLELKASESEVLAAKKAFYPNFIIQGSLGLNAFKAALMLEAPSSFAFQFLGGLTAPLLNRRELRANLLDNQSKKREQYLVLEKTIVNSFTEVYQLVRTSTILAEQTILKQNQVNILERSIQTSNSLFVSGRANYLEIINAQQSYLKARLELIELFLEQQHLNTHLYKALGGGQ